MILANLFLQLRLSILSRARVPAAWANGCVISAEERVEVSGALELSHGLGSVS